MPAKFTTTLTPAAADIVGGYASGPAADPSTLADTLFGPMSGPWLCCYMIRRFGWPNTESDDHKQLCSWNLTTPLAGLHLCVTPYLGNPGRNLHFAIRYEESMADLGGSGGEARTREVDQALTATLNDLLRPVMVRDNSFTPFGNLSHSKEAMAAYKEQPEAERFVGAGYTPEYWFTQATPAERSGQA